MGEDPNLMGEDSHPSLIELRKHLHWMYVPLPPVTGGKEIGQPPSHFQVCKIDLDFVPLCTFTTRPLVHNGCSTTSWNNDQCIAPLLHDLWLDILWPLEPDIQQADAHLPVLHPSRLELSAKAWAAMR